MNQENTGGSGEVQQAPAMPLRKVPKGQPSGLWVLFITEMWERFSYYGMRALLVFYLVAKTSEINAGFGWSEEDASKLYGWYTALVYLTPIAGGWLADKFLGTHRSMLVGGWIIAAGHFCLAATELFGNTAEKAITFASVPGPFLTFMAGLVLIIIGTGFFKPCVSVMVGQLYREDDPRRDSGFTIFYMGINVGAFLSGVVAGTLGEKVGWHWGFGSAGVGMIAGLLTYQFFRPMFLKGVGLPPHHQPEHDEKKEPTPEQIKQAEQDEYERTRPLTRVDWDRMAVVMILAVFAIVFWVAFEQAGSSLNLFALNQTDRQVMGSAYEFPATWYQSVNPAAIVLFAPIFAWLWLWLDKRGRQPSTPVKFAIGLMLLSAGYVVMIFGAIDAGNPMTIALKDAPAGAKATILQQAGESEIEKITKLEWQEQGEFCFAEWTEDAGEDEAAMGNNGNEDDTPSKSVRILAAADGKLLTKSTEVVKKKKDGDDKDDSGKTCALDQLPAPARETILRQAGKNELQQIEQFTRHDTEFYDAQWTEDGRELRVSVAGDGSLWSKATQGFEKVGRAGPNWLLVLYVMVTWGELCLSPVGLSMVTKLSPSRYTSMMMGLYFGSYFIANLAAGYLAAFSSRIAAGEVFTVIGGQADFFLFLFAVPLVVGLVVFALSSVIKKMMHGLH